MGFIATDVRNLILQGESSGESLSLTSKKISKVAVGYARDRACFVLDDAVRRCNLSIDFDGDVTACQRWKIMISRARRSVELWEQEELKKIEEGA